MIVFKVLSKDLRVVVITFSPSFRLKGDALVTKTRLNKDWIPTLKLVTALLTATTKLEVASINTLPVGKVTTAGVVNF